MSCVPELLHYPLVRLARLVFLFYDANSVVVQVYTVFVSFKHLQKSVLKWHTMTNTDYHTGLLRAYI